MVKKVIAIVLSLVLVVVCFCFYFLSDKISKREVSAGVYEYYFHHNWIEGTEGSQAVLYYPKPSPNVYTVGFVFSYGLADLFLELDPVFTDYTEENIPIGSYTGRLYSLQQYNIHRANDTLDEISSVSVYNIELSYAIYDLTGMYRPVDVVLFDINLDGFTALNTLFVSAEQFGITFDGVFDFDEVEDFWDGLLAGLDVLLLPVYAIIGLFKAICTILAIFGGFVTL